MVPNRNPSAGSARSCEEAEAKDSGAPPCRHPPGGSSEREQEREEERRRSGRANAGVSKRPPGEEESTESGEEEITQPVLFSHPLPTQVGTLLHTERCLLGNLHTAGANLPGKPAHGATSTKNHGIFSHMKMKKTPT